MTRRVQATVLLVLGAFLVQFVVQPVGLGRVSGVSFVASKAEGARDPETAEEIISLRQPSVRTFKTKSGYRVDLAAEPSTADFDGQINQTVVRETLSADHREVFAYETDRWRAQFPRDLNVASQHFEFEGRWFELRLEDVDRSDPAPRSGRKSGPLSLLYGEDADDTSIRYDFGSNVVKESIILRRFTGQSEWRFRLTTGGFVPTKRPDGGIGLVFDSSQTEEAWSLLPTVAVDATGASTTGTLELDAREDGSWTVSVGVSSAWLSAKERVYPVEVDPTVTLSAQADASMWTVLSYGEAYPYTGNTMTMESSSNDPNPKRGLVKFDVNSIPQGILANNQLTRATLTVYTDPSHTACAYYSSATDCLAELSVKPLAKEWFRSTAVWGSPAWNATWDGGEVCQGNNCPGVPSDAFWANSPQFSTLTPPVSVSVDITRMVQRTLEGSHPNYGYRVDLAGTIAGVFYRYTAQARDALGNTTNPPTLTLEFADDSVPPTIAISSPSPGTEVLESTNVTVTSSDLLSDGSPGSPSVLQVFLDGRVVGTPMRVSQSGTYTISNVDVRSFLAGSHDLVVRAYDRAGNYSDSAPVSLTLLAGQASTPSHVTVRTNSDSTQSISWTPSVAAKPSQSLSPYDVTYHVLRASSPPYTSFTTIATNVASTTFTDSPGTGTHYYAIRAVTSPSAWGAISRSATAAAPSPPYGLGGRVLPDSRVVLSWYPSLTAETDSSVTYRVYMNDDPSPIYSGPLTTIYHNLIASGTPRTYRVTAVNLSGESSSSAPYSVTPYAVGGPDAPTEVRASPGSGLSVTVSWTAAGVTGATYDLYRSPDRANWASLAAGMTGTSFDDANVSEGVTYYYYLRTVVDGVAGPASAIAGAQAGMLRRAGADRMWPITAVSDLGGTVRVNLSNGNVIIQTRDLALPTPLLAVEMTRVYNSLGRPDGAFGDRWRLTADWRVQDLGFSVVVSEGDGTEHSFLLTPNGYQGDKLLGWNLTNNGGQFTLTRPDRIQYNFDSQGRLSSITDRSGNQIIYTYGTNGKLARVQDPVGRITTVSYDTSDRPSRIQDVIGRAVDYQYDTLGRLSMASNWAGEVSSYSYDSDGRLSRIASNGTLVSLKYDDTGRLAYVLDAHGLVTSYDYTTDSTGAGTANVTDAVGAKTTIAYNPDGFVTLFTDAVQNTKLQPESWSISYAFHASDSNRLESVRVTNPDGLQTTTTYDLMGNVTSEVQTGTDLTSPGVNERTSTKSYVAGFSDLSLAQDPENGQTMFSWDSAAPHHLLSIQTPGGATTQYSYSTDPSQRGWIRSKTDPIGNVITYDYDSLGQTTRVSYVLSSTKTVVQDFTFNPDGTVSTRSEIHDQSTQASSLTQMEYDTAGRLTRVRHPDGTSERWLYDLAGRVVLHQPAGSLVESYEYDRLGRLVSTKDANSTTLFDYDAVGNQTAVTNARGKTTTYSYDNLGRVTRMQSPEGVVTEQTYNDVGNLSSQTVGGVTYSATYYQLGLLRQLNSPVAQNSVLNADGTFNSADTITSTTYSYNRLGQPVSVLDGNGNLTSYGYNGAHQLVTVTDALGGLTEYAYDLNGNRTHIWDPEHPRSSGFSGAISTFDALGRVVASQDGQGGLTLYVYDDAGNLTITRQQRSAGTLDTVFQYDDRNRLVSTVYPDLIGHGPKSATSFSYDGGGRRLLKRDESGITSYSYDSNGRINRVIGPNDNIVYTYDLVGNITSLRSAFGTLTYTYNGDNQVSYMTDPMGWGISFTYANGLLVSELYPSGIRRSVSYWNLYGSAGGTDRLREVWYTVESTGTKLWKANYYYDLAGNVRRSAYDIPNSAPSNYSVDSIYDALHRLIGHTDGSISDQTIQTTHYQYDASGNRLVWGNQNASGQITQKTPKGTVVTFDASYDAANRMVTQRKAMEKNWRQLTPGSLSTNVYNEPNGNTLSERYWYPESTSAYDALADFVHNDADRLVSHTAELLDSVEGWRRVDTYRYDGDGRRLEWKSTFCEPYPSSNECTGSSVTTSYQRYDYASTGVVSERKIDGTISVYYVRTPDGQVLYSLLTNGFGSVDYTTPIRDRLGTVHELIGGASTKWNEYRYDAFGVPTFTSVTRSHSYRFAGAPLDTIYRSSTAEYSTFYNLQARLYNPSSGRFITQDTWKGDPWRPWTQNLYVYVGNNPVNYIDPTGHVPVAVALIPVAKFLVEALTVGVGIYFLAHPVERHHPWPKYLGGDKSQPLVDLPTDEHIDLHKKIDEFAPRWRGTDYYRNLPKAELEQILEQLKDLYRDNCPSCLEELLKQLEPVSPNAPSEPSEGGTPNGDQPTPQE